MKRFRTALFWAHLCVGLAAGLVVLVMSVTGVLLTYQRQITAWADVRGLDGTGPAGAARLPVAALLAAVPMRGAPATAIAYSAPPDRPVQIAFGRERVVYLNGYTGAVLGEGNAFVRRFFRSVTDWHRWLARPDESRWIGKAITGAANLGFLFLVLSGCYLWWPRNATRTVFRGLLWFRRGLSPKARDFNWHHVIGFWSAVPLAIVVASGVVISYGWAGDLVYRIAGEQPPARGAAPESGRSAASPADAPGPPAALDPLLARAARQVPAWRMLTLHLPEPGADSVRFTLDRGTGGQPHLRGTLTFDRSSGAVRRWEPFSAASPGRRARMVLRFAHTGEVLGLLGQTLAGLVTAGSVVLVWTGFALTWRRFRGRRERTPRGAPRTRRRREAAGIR